ncbi:MAG: thiamine pyrophosphate-binding protein [Deltaproteobacteria bacterium]|nr:thiamine pyrophosphate-binding protein [Deltaproteobacteria bacterium]
MARMTAGQAVVEGLRAEGVDHVFGLIGSCSLEIVDALYDAKEIRFVGSRHEQAAAHMADAYARLSGKPGVVLVTNGPGATNLVTGVALAKLAHSPVIALTGAVMTAQEGKDCFQELDQVAMFRPITKASLRVNRPERIPEVLRHAFRIALTGKRGPVHVDIPRDLLYGEAEVDPVEPGAYRPDMRVRPARDLLERAATLLASARAPVILAGGGVKVARAWDAVLALAERLGAPVVTSAGHRDAVPNDHPLFCGQLGAKGSPLARRLAQQTDLLLAAGTRLGHYTTFYGRDYIGAGARIIQIEIDPVEIGRHYPVEVGLLGDVGEVLRELLGLLPSAGGPDVIARRAELEGLRAAWLEERARPGEDTSMPLKPARVFAELRQVLPRGTVVTMDVGSVCALAVEGLDFPEPGTLLGTLDLGALGFAFPAGLGARAARPDRAVVSLSGDGAFGMNALEIETAVRCHLPCVAIVLNNFCWGSEKVYQRDFYEGRYYAVDLGNPPYDELARLCGARGYRVERPGELPQALVEALRAEEPAVIDVIVDPDALAPAARRDAVRPRGARTRPD